MKLSLLYVAVLCLFGHQVLAQSNTPCTAGVVTAPNIAVNASCTFQAGTTVGATASTNAANGGTPSCGSMGPDVWYSFTAPASGTIDIQTSAGSITDGVMALYSGSCGAWTQITCSDDVVGLMPAISAGGLTPGVTYLIRFWQYGGGTGTFNICISAAAPAAGNTTCSVPSPICSGSPINFIANAGGSSADVINPGNNYTCLFTSPNPSWYYLEIATAGNLVIDITAGADIDYSIWGPFPNLANAISNCNTYALPQDCSYSPSPIEQAVVNGVSVGQVYVLLVTNFANVVQTININQAASNTATTNCAIVPLPVGYTYWNAQYNEGAVDLIWGTEFEEDNRDFVVQRSADGMVWETIGAVAGNNTTNNAQNYSYTDHKPLTGISYYRLMQVDADGDIEYNSVLSVSSSDIEPFTVYPNPANNNFSIYTKSKKMERVVLTDMVGKSFDVDYTTTSNGVEIDCSNYAAGVYTLTVVTNGTAQSQRLIIKK
jgi:Secretion system C-terminal sorting domain